MKKFTLIEMMFVVGILVILIGIGVSASNKIYRKAIQAQTKAEISLIVKAVYMWKERYSTVLNPWPVDELPDGYSGPMDFFEKLSDVEIGHSSWGSSRPREMYINKNAGLNLSVDYDNASLVGSGAVKVRDPYEQDYQIKRTGEIVEVRSAGLDGQMNTADDVTN